MVGAGGLVMTNPQIDRRLFFSALHQQGGSVQL